VQKFRTYLVGLIIALVLLGQGFAAAHASTYGDTPHDHEGTLCDVTLISEEIDDLITPPAPELVTDRIAHALPAHATPSPFTFPSPHSRAPPPRAPPHIQI